MMAGMKADGNFLDTEDIYIGWEQMIQTFHDLLWCYSLYCAQVGNLAKGMNAGVCSPRPLNIYFPPEQFFSRVNKRTLDTFLILLCLPATVACPVVFQSYFVLISHA